MRRSSWVACVLLSLSTPALAAAPAEGPSPEQKAGAQKTFDAGSKLFDAHRYEEALAAFRASYQILASPNSHLMVARALREVGKNVDAYLEYQAVAREAAAKGERYESAGHAATEEGEELRPKIAFLTVKVAGDPAGVAVRVAGTELAADALGTAVPRDPGTVTVTADRADGAKAAADVVLTAGNASETTLTLTAPAAAVPAEAPPPAVVHVSSSGPPLRTLSYVAGGVGVVGLATFAVFGAMSNSKYSSLDSSCAGRVCSPDKQSDVDAGRRDQTIANIGLVLGVVGVGAGITLFVVSSPHSTETASAPSLRAAVGPGTLAVDGRF